MIFFLSVIFINNLLTIKNRQTWKVVATGKRDGELYVLERDDFAFICALRNKSLRASYNYYVISFLNKKVIFLLRLYCLLHHYIVPVSLRKVIDCFILAMNVGRLLCYILFIIIFGILSSSNPIRVFFIMLFLLMIILDSIGFTL